MKIVITSGYARQAKRWLTPAERETGEAEIIERPDAWPVIPGTGGARKARIARGSRGKSGGARVIYFFVPSPAVIVFLDVYAKAAKENLTDAERKALRAIVQGFQAEIKGAAH
jgi:mRNA-degrading endonuclease RelE of RelBE toxin-antitoxin system